MSLLTALLLPSSVDKYSPDQPRDERGRWTADGGDSATESKRPEGVQVAFNDTAAMMTDFG